MAFAVATYPSRLATNRRTLAISCGMRSSIRNVRKRITVRKARMMENVSRIFSFLIRRKTLRLYSFDSGLMQYAMTHPRITGLKYPKKVRIPSCTSERCVRTTYSVTAMHAATV